MVFFSLLHHFVIWHNAYGFAVELCAFTREGTFSPCVGKDKHNPCLMQISTLPFKQKKK